MKELMYLLLIIRRWSRMLGFVSSNPYRKVRHFVGKDL